MAKKRNVKNKKKEELKKVVESEEQSFNLHNKMFTVFCILMFFLAFYLLALYITNKHSDKSQEDNSNTEVKVSQEEIILGRSLSMKDGEYFVIYYDSKDEENAADLSSLVSNYRASHDISLYYVDMASGFNKSHITDGDSNHNPESASDLLIKGPTVIKVNDKRVVEYIEGLDAVKDYLS